jgi:hypothetical protein
MSCTQLLRPLGFEHIEALEIGPVEVHGMKSVIQAALWHFFRAMTVLRIAAETGQLRGHILTVNLHIIAHTAAGGQTLRIIQGKSAHGQINAAPPRHRAVASNMKLKQGANIVSDLPKKLVSITCFLCAARAYCCNAAMLLPPMPSLGVSSLDLGRLWQRRRPLSLSLPIALFTAERVLLVGEPRIRRSHRPVFLGQKGNQAYLHI